MNQGGAVAQMPGNFSELKHRPYIKKKGPNSNTIIWETDEVMQKTTVIVPQATES